MKLIILEWARVDITSWHDGLLPKLLHVITPCTFELWAISFVVQGSFAVSFVVLPLPSVYFFKWLAQAVPAKVLRLIQVGHRSFSTSMPVFELTLVFFSILEQKNALSIEPCVLEEGSSLTPGWVPVFVGECPFIKFILFENPLEPPLVVLDWTFLTFSFFHAVSEQPFVNLDIVINGGEQDALSSSLASVRHLTNVLLIGIGILVLDNFNDFWSAHDQFVVCKSREYHVSIS